MPETIGQQLKQAREARNLTIEKVVQATRLRARHIEAIEADDFEGLPSPVQVRAFLRIYAEFLGLSLDDLIARQRAGTNEPAATLPNREPVSSQSQEQSDESVQPSTSAAGSAGEPAAGKVSIIKDKIKEFLVHLKKITPRPKTPLAPVQSAPNPPSEPIEAKGEEPDPAAPILQAQVNEDEESGLPDEASSSSSGAQESQAVFAHIGEALRQRRESLSLTLDEIEHHTRIRQHYLRALESGKFDHIPSSVQTRGMLNNYAHFLDMDMDAILLQFAEGLQIQRLERQPQPLEKPSKPGAKIPSKNSLPPSLRRFLSMDTLVGSGLILLLLVFAIWGTSRVVGLRSASAPQLTAPSISHLLENTPEGVTATPSPTNEAGTAAVIPTAGETAIVTIPAAGQGAVQVVVVAQESAWVRVVVDGKKQFEGRVTPGKAYPYDGNTQIEVRTGDGAAISILYNQGDLGPMGSFGEVVDRIYTANTILSPTATSTPSPTITPESSITPQPSPTLRPSLTPRRSPTPIPEG
jgi:cytoskeletal protein RodZ